MILEMRTYVLKPGMTRNFVERFAEGLTARLQFSKLLGLWLSEVGGLNRVVHVWPYESFEDRERIGGEARKTGKWPPKTQEFIVTQENKFIQPAQFSPPLPERKLGEVYEFRTYTYQPGTMPTVLERFGKVIPARTKISPLVFAGQTIVVTHHAPMRESLAPRYAEDLVSAGFVNHLPTLARAPASLWIHGHTHTSFDYVVEGTRVVCNPRGYFSRRAQQWENPDFAWDKVVEI